MGKITLKVDVDTLRGTQEGVPALARILDQFSASATFLFSLGPDHTGWAMRRVFRQGFLQKASRTSVLKHYGLKQLMYGIALPGPDIGKKAQAEMRAIAQVGFECGIHTWDHVYWQDHVQNQNAQWTHAQMQKSYQRFMDIFHFSAPTHGAAGWQMNVHALAKIDEWQMLYASDGRGTHPYRIQLGEQCFHHVQLPTTLPTLDELIGTNNLREDNVAQHLLNITQDSKQDHVFTLHAELEGQKLQPIFQQLLAGWRAQGHELVNMAHYFSSLDVQNLPIYPLSFGQIPGRSGTLMIQNSSMNNKESYHDYNYQQPTT